MKKLEFEVTRKVQGHLFASAINRACNLICACARSHALNDKACSTITLGRGSKTFFVCLNLHANESVGEKNLAFFSFEVMPLYPSCR